MSSPAQNGADKRAKRARRFEHDADQLVGETREATRRRPEFGPFLTLLRAADDAADELEDAAFLLDLDLLEGKPLENLQTLADWSDASSITEGLLASIVFTLWVLWTAWAVKLEQPSDPRDPRSATPVGA